jgi:hypothetical protein
MSPIPQSHPRFLGVTGCLIGLLAFIVAVLPFVWPANAPEWSSRTNIVEPSHSLKERIAEKLKGLASKKLVREWQEDNSDQVGWRQNLPIAAILLALLAVTLGVFSALRREEKFYAGLATALGIGAISVEMAMLYASGIIVVLILSVMAYQFSDMFQVYSIPVGAVFIVILTISSLGLLFISPALAGALAVAIILLSITSQLFGS